MRATSQKLIQRSLVQPATRTFDERARIKVCSGISPYYTAGLPEGYYDTILVLQLCNFDMKSPTLNERIAVVFAFPGHLAADALRSSLTDLLDVRTHAASTSQLLCCSRQHSECMQRYQVCCARLSIHKREGFLICNSAGWSFLPAAAIAQ